MDYMFSQHDLGFLDDVIPEKDKKKKEDEKKKKKKQGSIDSDGEDVSFELTSLECNKLVSLYKQAPWQPTPKFVNHTNYPPALLPTLPLQQHVPLRVYPLANQYPALQMSFMQQLSHVVDLSFPHFQLVEGSLPHEWVKNLAEIL